VHDSRARVPEQRPQTHDRGEGAPQRARHARRPTAPTAETGPGERRARPDDVGRHAGCVGRGHEGAGAETRELRGESGAVQTGGEIQQTQLSAPDVRHGTQIEDGYGHASDVSTPSNSTR
jgi:hypothetical protein